MQATTATEIAATASARRRIADVIPGRQRGRFGRARVGAGTSRSPTTIGLTSDWRLKIR